MNQKFNRILALSLAVILFCSLFSVPANVGVVEVHDERLDKIVEIVKPRSIVPTSFSFTDIAGLVKGASHGEGLGNQFLSHIRDVDAICQVVRCFDNGQIVHVSGKVDPIDDIETVNLELILEEDYGVDVFEARLITLDELTSNKIGCNADDYTCRDASSFIYLTSYWTSSAWNSDNVWSSIADLMSGLMIVFLFTSVIFMSKVIDENTNIKNQQQTVENIVTTYEESKINIYEDLYNEFEDDMDRWDMEVDKDGTIRFKEPEVFFDTGESEIKDQFKDTLNSFFPRYINLIYKNYKDKVTEIRAVTFNF